ncbi:hypothetical protein [Thermococcus piezophilus]|uniref:Oligosaccharide repeat unit polymerase n=1 Tax=Thermococcus piezophilus TaxID=1712654 RepID=A0A172WHJ2_9EURY|nr:hypothetical protein [Thermococcus piezophilus]ANF22917.1 hypothetical protein A7C91_06835 [Thermococcus piezophilus]
MRLNVIFWISAVAYILLALVAKLAYPKLLPKLEWDSLLYALAFLGVLAFAYSASERIQHRYKSAMYLAVLLLMPSCLGWWGLLVALAIIVTTHVIIYFERHKVEDNSENARWKLRIILIAAVVILAIVPLVFGVIPLLQPETRYSSLRLLYLTAGYFTVAILAIKPDFKVFLIGEAIAIVSTFRTVGIAVALAYFLKLVQTGKLRWDKRNWRSYAILAVVFSSVFAVFIIRYYTTLQTYPEWKLGFSETLLYRPGVTYTVYERLFELGMPWGKQAIIFSVNPKGYVGALFRRDVGYTYTLFGQPAYDFGILGLVEAVFLGIALADSERRRTTEVLAVTFMTLAVPIGLDTFFLSAMAFFAYLAVEVERWRKSA